VKHRLPTLDGKHASRRDSLRSAAQEWAAWSGDRTELPDKVIAVAHVNQSTAAAKLATELCTAFARESARVSALVTVDSPAVSQEAEALFFAVRDAGAREATLLKRPQQEPREAVRAAVAELGTGADWIVAWGNVLPMLYKPYFTIVVTGHRRDLADSDHPLVMNAQLEVTAPGPELATLLARRLTQDSDA
jgi:hypothetical protein